MPGTIRSPPAAGDDFVAGGLGNDTFVATAATATTATTAAAAPTPMSLGDHRRRHHQSQQATATGVDTGTDALNTIENATGGAGNDLVVGNSLDNVLIGGAGNDTLNGTPAPTPWSAATGNDIYNVDNAGDVVTEAVGRGNDTVSLPLSATRSLRARRSRP